MGATTLAIAAHKFHGPKGVGALYVRNGAPLLPLVVGGGHERGLRAGTLNVPGIVGMVRAAEIAMCSFGETIGRIEALRDRLHAGITAECPTVELNGAVSPRQCNNLNLRAWLCGVGTVERTGRPRCYCVCGVSLSIKSRGAKRRSASHWTTGSAVSQPPINAVTYDDRRRSPRQFLA